MSRFARIAMAGISLIWIATAQAQQHDMTFFVTSTGKGNGAKPALTKTEPAARPRRKAAKA